MRGTLGDRPAWFPSAERHGAKISCALPEISGGLPVRDPRFSPDHEVFIGGILAQAGAVQGAVPAIFT